MAIDKPDWETKTAQETEDEAKGVFTKPSIDELPPGVKDLYDSVRASIDKTNEHITDVATIKSDISTNTSNITTATNKANTNATSISLLNTAEFRLDKNTILKIDFIEKEKLLRFTITIGKTSLTGSLTLK